MFSAYGVLVVDHQSSIRCDHTASDNGAGEVRDQNTSNVLGTNSKQSEDPNTSATHHYIPNTEIMSFSIVGSELVGSELVRSETRGIIQVSQLPCVIDTRSKGVFRQTAVFRFGFLGGLSEVVRGGGDRRLVSYALHAYISTTCKFFQELWFPCFALGLFIGLPR